MNKIIALLLNKVKIKGCIGFKIYESTPEIVYFYRDFDGPYYDKCKIQNLLVDDASFFNIIPEDIEKIDKDKENFYNRLYTEGRIYLQDIFEIKISKLKKEEKAVRFRLDLQTYTSSECEKAITRLLNKKEIYTVPYTDAPIEIKKEKKKMEDFSLTNLKNALVNKITHLDKKTITILAIISLALLIVGKYQDIKDILIGIKDKVKRSKNFKAMVADGTAAVNSLKKILGIKNEGKDNNEDEA